MVVLTLAISWQGTAQGGCYASGTNLSFSATPSGSQSSSIQGGCSDGSSFDWQVGTKPSWLSAYRSGSSVVVTVSNNTGGSRSGSVQLVKNGSQIGIFTVSQAAGLVTVGQVSITSGPTQRCNTGSTDYNASATNATSYSWTLSPSSAGTINSNGNVTWNGSNFGTVQVIVTAYGPNSSSSTATRNVSFVGVSTPGLTASASEFCTGQSVTLTIGPLENNVYYELLRNNIQTGMYANGSEGSKTWTVTSGGTYSIRATQQSSPNCSFTYGSVLVTEKPALGNVSFTSGPTSVCKGSSPTSFTASAANATGYSWNLSPTTAGTISTSGTVTWNSGYTGSATVSVTASGNCSQTDTETRSVQVGSPPTVYSLSSGTPEVCSGSTTSLTLSDSQSGVNYQLYRNNAVSGSPKAGTGSAISWSGATSGTYKVVASNSNGTCNSIDMSNQVSIGTKVAEPIGINPSSGSLNEICPGTIALFPTYVNSVQNWTGVDSWTSTNALVTLAAGQSKSVTLYATDNCDVSKQITVTLTGATGPSDTSIDSGDTQVCQDTSQSTYVGSANNASSHVWSIEPVAAGTIDQNGTVNWSGSYMGQVTITYEASNSCNQTDTAQLTVDVTNSVTFYEDKDRDGFYISTVTGCTNPDTTVYVTEEAIIGSGDCDDNDEVLNPNTIWYEDIDGDGLGDPNVTLVRCEQPTGYVLTPDVEGPLTEDPLPDLSGLDTQDMNTTFSVEPYTPTTTLTEIDALPANGKVASRVYYDGLGRPIQEVALHAGGISYEGYTGNDIVNYIEYDRFGRTVKRFSAYGKLDQTVAGDFETEAKTEQMQFYTTGNLQNSYAHTANPFSETVFDRSPRNRAIRQASPGDNWSIDSGNEVSMGYFFNVQDEVRYFKVELSNDLIPTLLDDGHYAANELVKNVVRDENWVSGQENTAEEFVNKDGQTVLKRTYVNGTTLSTYYVYDDYGNLTYVLPPKLEPDTATITTALLNSLAFQYRYDYLRRQVEKRNPGVDGWESIVYDYEDRPILAQDANMALNDHWLFTKYDKFGRPVYTGLFSSTQSRAQLQLLADNWVTVDQKTHNEERTVATTTVGGTPINYSNEAFPDSNLELLSINYYDDYAITDGDLPTTPTSVMGQNVTTNTKGLATISWVKVLDGQPNSWNKTYTYYDAKARALRVHTKNYQQGYTILDNELDFRGKIVNSITQHQKDDLDPLVSIKDSYTYDHMERIRTQSQALYNGDASGTAVEDKLVAGFLYDALGQLTKKYVEPASDGFGWRVGLDDSTNALEAPNGNSPGIIVSREFSLSEPGIYDVDYDFLGDTSGVAYSIVLAINHGASLVYRENLTTTELGNAINFVAAVSGTYTVELSFTSPNGTFSADSNFAPSRINLVSNTILPVPSSGLAHRDVPALQMVDYQYNARGSMTQINDIDDLQNDLFAYRMHYDDPTTASGAAPMYNGNIAEVQWRTQNDGSPRGYGYAYDALSRITGANDNTGNYNISNVSYDKNGNLLTLNRKGWGEFNGTNTFGDIDMLNYSSYDGNKLLKVMDTGNTAEGFQYNSGAAVDYTYDANGNMVSDVNKGIALIEYNHLDLPTKITFANGDNISYLYDAMGTKLKKTAVLNNNPTMTEYWNGFQYNMGELQFFAQPEGYVAVGETAGQRSFDYVYHYTDHLGNIRLSYSDIDDNGNIDATTEIIKENNYYPFGMLHKSNMSLVHPLGTGYTYGFNGKELQEGGNLVWLDFGSRNYDPALGRWMNIDPQSGRYMAMSPFAAMGNNPVTFVDPNGEELATSIIIGAVAGAIIGGATTAITNPRADFGDILGGAFIGAFSGTVTAGIGEVFGTAGVLANSSWQPFAQAGTHALFQGTMSAAQGGNFWQGAATAAASSLIGGATANGGLVGQSAMGAFTGGFTSLLTGGSFEQGFATGLTVSLLNQALHRAAKSIQQSSNTKKENLKPFEEEPKSYADKLKEINMSKTPIVYPEGDYNTWTEFGSKRTVVFTLTYRSFDLETTLIMNGRDFQKYGSYIQWGGTAITASGFVPLGVGINRFGAGVGLIGAGMESYGSGDYSIMAKSTIGVGVGFGVGKLGAANPNMTNWQSAIYGQMWGYMTKTTISNVD